MRTNNHEETGAVPWTAEDKHWDLTVWSPKRPPICPGSCHAGSSVPTADGHAAEGKGALCIWEATPVLKHGQHLRINSFQEGHFGSRLSSQEEPVFTASRSYTQGCCTVLRRDLITGVTSITFKVRQAVSALIAGHVTAVQAAVHFFRRETENPKWRTSRGRRRRAAVASCLNWAA